jgi:hypothetical protein
VEGEIRGTNQANDVAIEQKLRYEPKYKFAKSKMFINPRQAGAKKAGCALTGRVCECRNRLHQVSRKVRSGAFASEETAMPRYFSAAGRIPFNQPSRKDRRLKANPPYASW